MINNKILFCVFLFAGLQAAQNHYEYKRFGLEVMTGFNNISLPDAVYNRAAKNYQRREYTAGIPFEIQHTPKHFEYIYFFYTYDQLYQKNRRICSKNIFSVATIDNRTQYLNEYFSLLRYGGLGFSFYNMKTPRAVFEEHLYPAYNYITSTGLFPQSAVTVDFLGFSMKMLLNLAVRNTIASRLISDFSGQGIVWFTYEYLQNTDAKSGFSMRIRASLIEKIGYEFANVMPYLKLELAREWDMHIFRRYRINSPFMFYFGIGIDFKFSLCCFG
ncbi:MAG: hypothetical protein A2096_00895 [Spirochaetes bacterium GWF1_41_5]|nr:MAG: hypothetical protein A2096_00895 [Spirochaetes bacterium GWF1_41_5]HBE02966.1 hypothetical protein [Spirochaetia bacterium]